MRKEKIVSLAVVLVMVGVAFVAITPASGFLLQEHVRYGTYSNSGVGGTSNNQWVSAWIDGVNYSHTESRTYSGPTFSAHTFGDEDSILSRILNKRQGGRDDTLDGGIREIVYSIGSDFSVGGSPKTIHYAAETSTFAAGSYENVALSFSTIANDHLIISEVIPGPSAGNDYLFVYSPGAPSLTSYYLATNDGEIVTLTGSAVASKHNFVDLGGDILDTSADEIKLVYDRTSDGPSNDDIVVDRVEWGNSLTLPGDTTMPDATSPSVGESMIRVGDTDDTNDCLADFITSASPHAFGANWPGGLPTRPGIAQAVFAATNGAHVRLSWNAPGSGGPPTGYKIYEDSNNDLSDGFQGVEIDDVAGSPHDMTNHYNDALSHYYRIIPYNAGGENESDGIMAYKHIQTINSASVAWNIISLPYTHSYAMLSDITDEFVDNTDITGVAFFDAAANAWRSRSWTPSGGGRWTAFDDVIPAGAAIRLIGQPGLPTWKLVGSYEPITITIQAASVSWNIVSIPYDSTYTMLSDVTDEFVDNTDITGVAFFDAAANAWRSRSWTPSGGGRWTAFDEVIPIGAGIRLIGQPGLPTWDPVI